MTVSEDTVRLAGREQATGIDVALTIPHSAIRKIRVERLAAAEVVGEPSVVLELLDEEPIYIRPISTGPLDLDNFARKLRTH